MQLVSKKVASEMRGPRANRETVLGSENSMYLFYHLNIRLVSSMYSQVPWSGQVLSSLAIEQESGNERSLAIERFIPSLRAGIKKATSLRATYEDERNAERMYRRAQEYLYDTGQLSPIDLVDGSDMAPIAGLISQYIKLERDYEFPLLPDEIDSLKVRWREQQEKEGAQHILGLDGIVAIRARFKMERNSLDGAIFLRASSESKHGLSVLAPFSDKSPGRDGCARLIPGETIDATCVGWIKDRNLAKRELVILPVAVFAVSQSIGALQAFASLRSSGGAE
jgi:hypothetical protein